MKNIGDRFGRLVINDCLGIKVFPGGSTVRIFECSCDCGVTKVMSAKNLYKTKSCGCLIVERSRERCTTHGMSYFPEYRNWAVMLSRCRNKKHSCYPSYGGRGIKVCDSWYKFENFYKDMGEKPTKTHSIDRIDGKGNYCPENCRWATPKEQARNTSRNFFITYNKQTKTIAEWSEILGVNAETIKHRYGKKRDIANYKR